MTSHKHIFGIIAGMLYSAISSAQTSPVITGSTVQSPLSADTYSRASSKISLKPGFKSNRTTSYMLNLNISSYPEYVSNDYVDPSTDPNFQSFSPNLPAFGSIGSSNTDQLAGFNHNIPVSCAPGTAGMQPNLAIVYNSLAGRTWMGMGFNLSGLSNISRIPNTKFYDGVNRAVEFNTNDAFALDGTRLLIKNWTGDYAGSTYKLEVENYSTITAYGTGVPSYFVVVTRDGLIMQYGTTANSKSTDVTGVHTMTWYLTRVEDKNGNFMELEYNRDNGESTIKEIRYTGNGSNLNTYNKIEFKFIDRTDRSTRIYHSSVSGSTSIEFRYSKLLKKISCKGVGDVIFRDYTFDYIYRSGSLLAKLTESGLDNQLNPICFDWTSVPQFTPITNDLMVPVYNQTYNYVSNLLTMSADLTGDTKDDVIMVLNTNIPTQNTEPTVVRFLASQLPGSFWFGYTCPDFTLTTGVPRILGSQAFDENDDGYVEAFIIWSAPSASSYNVSRLQTLDGINFSLTTVFTGALASLEPDWFEGDNYRSALISFFPKSTISFSKVDIDGDNQNDVIVSDNFGLHIQPTSASSFSLALDDIIKTKIGDFDGDGTAEIFVLRRQESLCEANPYDLTWYGIDIYKYNGGSNSLTLIANRSFETGTIFYNLCDLAPILAYQRRGAELVDFADVNGDGKTDFVHVNVLGNNTVDIYVAYSNGAALQNDEKVANVPSKLNGFDAGFYFMDLNNNGIPELCSSANDNANSVAYFSSYENTGTLAWLQTPIVARFKAYVNVTGDFDGDGTFDLVSADYKPQTSANWLFWLDRNIFKADPKNLLTRIHNIKNEVKVSYERLGGIYRRSVSTNPNNYLVTLPRIFAVSTVTNDFIVSKYGYATALFNRMGRGFVGFEKIYSADATLPAVTNGTASCYRGSITSCTYNAAYDAVIATETKQLDLISDDIFSIGPDPKVSKWSRSVFNFTTTGNSRYLASTEAEARDYLKSIRCIKTSTLDNTEDGMLTAQATKYLNWSSSTVIREEVSNYTYSSITLPLRSILVLQQNTLVQSGGGNSSTYVTDFTYDNKGNLISKVNNSNITGSQVTTSYTNNVFGVAADAEVTAADLSQSRGAHYVFDATGRFVTKETNSLGDFSAATFNNVSGDLLTRSSANGLTTKYAYDCFGQLIKSELPSGAVNRQNMIWYEYTEDRYAPSRSAYAPKITNIVEGSSSSTVYFDILGNNLRKETTGFGGEGIELDNTYDALGRQVSVEDPHFVSQTDFNKLVYEYDDYSRIKKQKFTLPGQGNTVVKSNNFYYNNISTNSVYNKGSYTVECPTSTSGGVFKVIKDNNEAGQITTIKNANASTTYTSQYVFNHRGQPTQVTASFPGLNSAVTSFVYDQLGRRTQLVDPSAGTFSYNFNSIGELTTSIDPRASTVFSYDRIGRLSSKTISGVGTYTYEYTATANGKGLIKKRTGPEVTDEYSYDDYSRIIQKKETITGGSPRVFSFNFAYDKYDRLISKIYPSGFAVSNVYDSQGILIKILNGNTVIWERKAEISPNCISEYVCANGQLTTTNLFDENLYLSETDFDGLSKQTYSFEPSSGNLLYRDNYIFSSQSAVNELFEYDDFDRLREINYVNSQNNVVLKNSLTYQENGNILTKQDCGTYTYGSTNKPYLLTALTSTAQNLSISDLNVTYNSLNLVSEIEQTDLSPKKFNFTYDNDYQRIKMTYSLNSQLQYTRFYQESYDREENGNTYKEWNYIYSPSGLVAVYHNINGTGQLLYIHCDRQGSPLMLTTSSGSVVEQYSYDSWGRRRNPNNWNDYSSNITHSYLIRGFTGHEHLDEVGLINMNGRIYDPVLGRFVQPDNYVQEPDNLQNFNRYSYCWNNPLKYTDPSGYWTANDWIAASLVVVGAALCFVPGGQAFGIPMIVGGASHFIQTTATTVNSGTSWNTSSNNAGVVVGVSFTANWGYKTPTPIETKRYEDLAPPDVEQDIPAPDPVVDYSGTLHQFSENTGGFIDNFDEMVYFLEWQAKCNPKEVSVAGLRTSNTDPTPGRFWVQPWNKNDERTAKNNFNNIRDLDGSLIPRGRIVSLYHSHPDYSGPSWEDARTSYDFNKFTFNRIVPLYNVNNFGDWWLTQPVGPNTTKMDGRLYGEKVKIQP